MRVDEPPSMDQEPQRPAAPGASERGRETYIEPVAAPLSRAANRGRAGPANRDSHRLARVSPRVLGFTIAMVVLGGAAAFVFIGLPDSVVAPTPAVPSTTAARAPPPSAGQPDSDEVIPPFRAEQLAMAKQQAREKLGAFVDLQLTLENDFHVAAWGAEELARIQDRANAADALFIQEQFESAIEEYAAALADLQALADAGETLFEETIAAGLAALDGRSAEAAAKAFERALTMRPGNARATAGARRADKLPAVLAELREAERAVLRGEYDAAQGHVAAARRLDPETAGLDARSARIAAARTTQRREGQLSDAFAALAAGRHQDALDAFDKVLREDSGHEAALAGRQQAAQARTRAAIDDLRTQALAQIDAEDWEAALGSYDAVLAIDPSLQFARDGKAAIRKRVMLIGAMQGVIDDPGKLSSDQEFAAANDTLQMAEEETGAGAKFAERLAEFRKLVARSAEPVELVLVSDNAMEVTIHKVGALGAFERRELALRPGRYVIVGSLDGCRDVRKEIVLSPDMAPVDIRCAERI